MKLAKDIAANFIKNNLPSCPPDKLIHAIYGQHPFEEPILAADIRCSECGGNDGSYVLDMFKGKAFRTWSCKHCPGPEPVYFPPVKECDWMLKDEPPIKKINPLDEIHQSPDFLFWARNWVNDPKGFVVISGTNGTGKTFAADAIARKIGQRISTTQAELNISWKSSFEKWGTDQYILNDYSKDNLLILDDLGTRTPTDAFMDFLYALVDRRYRNNSPTIITTNLIHKDLRERFGDAIASRIASGKCFRFDGKDRRIN